MKITHMTAIAAGAALLLLSACGQGQTTANATAGGDTEVSPVGAALERDWMPAAIVLPQPHTVSQDTKIGTRTHLLQIIVKDDPKAEFARWQAALEADGYEVNDNMLGDGRLLFQSAEVESGQIAVFPAEDEGYVIQVDVSRN